MSPAKAAVQIDARAAIATLQNLSDAIGGGLGADWAGPAVSTQISQIMLKKFKAGKFKRLAPSTIAARANRRGHYRQPTTGRVGVTPMGPPLVWTGRLMESMANPRGKGARDSRIRMAPQLLEQGTLVPYAVYHQSSASRSRLPRRPFLDLTGEEEESIIDVFLVFIKAATDSRGGLSGGVMHKVGGST